jgi:hypothetical protein
MALGSMQPLTEMSTRNIPGGKGQPACKADNLTAICEPIVQKMWKSQLLTALWASTACTGITLPLCMDLTSKEEYWTQFCMKLIAVISPNNYYSQLYRPSCELVK